MTFAPPAGAHGCTGSWMHAAGFYGSDDELLEVVVPFLQAGLAAGDLAVVGLEARKADLVRRAMPAARGLGYVPAPGRYTRPAVALAGYRQRFTDLLDRGAAGIRVVGEVPDPGSGAPWDPWRRYEATANHAFRGFPLAGLCVYDTRRAPPDVLADVRRTHPFVVTAGGEHHANRGYDDDAGALAHGPLPRPDPLEASAPALTLLQPSAGEACDAVAAVALRSFVDGVQIRNLVAGVSETVANALSHGRPPVVVRAWMAPDRVVVAVTDHGPGPGDPLVGLLPARSSLPGASGLGLWITHQLCDDVTLVRDGDGFTVRLAAARR